MKFLPHSELDTKKKINWSSPLWYDRQEWNGNIYTDIYFVRDEGNAGMCSFLKRRLGSNKTGVTSMKNLLLPSTKVRKLPNSSKSGNISRFIRVKQTKLKKKFYFVSHWMMFRSHVLLNTWKITNSTCSAYLTRLGVIGFLVIRKVIYFFNWRPG